MLHVEEGRVKIYEEIWDKALCRVCRWTTAVVCIERKQ